MAEQNDAGRHSEDVTVETDLSAEVAELLALLPEDIVEDLNAKRITLGEEGFLEGIIDHLQRHPALVQMNAARIGGHIKKVGKRLRKILREEHPEVETTSTVRKTTKNVGRNDRCPCGSGKKFKACCLNKKR